MKYFDLKTSLLMSLILLFLQSCDDKNNSPSEEINQPNYPEAYEHVTNHQTKYLHSLQLASGAIRDDEATNSRICPYFGNFACLALLKDPTRENVAMVKNYMLWYMGKLNGSTNPVSGETEISGSIYDYFGDTETTNGTYDSVDSYAATFLILAREYANCSNENKEWLLQYADRLTLIAQAMVKCIDTDDNTIPGFLSTDDNDGLSIASHVYDAKYLMDNCEVNQGLKAAKWLKENKLISENSGDFSVLLSRNTSAIESEFWRATAYNWFDNGNSLGINKWETFYPDATSQLYPWLFEVIDPLGDRSNRLYTQFNYYYPNWSKGEVYSGTYPWALVAYAAASLNDSARVESYIEYIYSYNVRDEQKDYWYSLEAAFVILAIDKSVEYWDVPSYVPFLN